MKNKIIKTGIFLFLGVLLLIVPTLVFRAVAEGDNEEIVNPSELGETYVGDVVADAMKKALNADVALVNGSSLGYTDLPEEITDKSVAALVPFDNDMVVAIRLKGDSLKRILARSCSMLPRRSSTFLQVSGVEFTCDLNQPASNRVFGILIDGNAIVPTKSYVVAATDFLSGGGGMKEFREGKLISKKGIAIGDAVINNATYDKKNIDTPDGRITIISAKEKE